MRPRHGFCQKRVSASKAISRIAWWQTRSRDSVPPLLSSLASASGCYSGSRNTRDAFATTDWPCNTSCSVALPSRNREVGMCVKIFAKPTHRRAAISYRKAASELAALLAGWLLNICATSPLLSAAASRRSPEET
ncbi:hypothetical protein CONLIGDRAFT_55503 [Coniochaeta ligniaria NRRL 30616]|uniref:Uncharacterized protein n=1 Tax=Coniochaeta ligniaria NRRL 30616 TaxID=1408157 RepID=A0A1J7JPR0_9PEZI|nr:hypothetical protein CONLIGDRAFT_55503 [Coniochaeta ligniaria NRRL 30616]